MMHKVKNNCSELFQANACTPTNIFVPQMMLVTTSLPIKYITWGHVLSAYTANVIWVWIEDEGVGVSVAGGGGGLEVCVWSLCVFVWGGGGV